jgi:hypothetical protein
MFTRGFCVLDFDLTPDRLTKSILVCPVNEMCALRHALKNHYRKPKRAFCKLFPGLIEIDYSRNVAVE